MNFQNKNKFENYYLIFFVFAIVIFLWITFYKNVLNHKTIEDNNVIDYDTTYNEIKDKLNDDNYERIWINPNDYKTFTGFLNDFKTFTWVEIDPTNENFSIWVKNEDWSITYIPFRQETIKSWIFNSDRNKNLAIIDIYSSYKDWMIYWSFWSKSWKKVIFEKDVNHPNTSILNDIYSTNISSYKIKDELEKIKKKWKTDYELISYLDEFVWDYKWAKQSRDKLCENNYDSCDKKTDIKISWTILDQNNLPVKWAKISLLNDENIFTYSDASGNYDLNFEYFPFSNLRLKSSVLWYSDWFFSLEVNTYLDVDWDNNYKLDFHLNKADDTVYVDKNSLDYKDKKYYTFKTAQSTYLVPSDWLYYSDWKQFKNDKFEVYLYEFNKWSNIDSLANNDTFTSVYWYVWNIMKTFWMPYIQFFDSNTKKELFVKKSNPMILRNQIYHMKELYENYDKIYEALTKEDMKFLVEKSNELWWYPIDFNFLIENDFLRWPARWVLDRKKWIWENIWVKVLNEEGLVEMQFYSINDL